MLRAIGFDLWETLITDTPDLSRQQERLRLTRMEAILRARGHEAEAARIERAYRSLWHQCHQLYWSEDRDVPCRRQIELLHDTVGLDGSPWRQRTIPLDPYALQPVRLCVKIDGGETGAASKQDRFAYWEQPVISTRQGVAATGEGGGDDDGATPGDLTPEELEVRRKHLKSLGYVG
jgi:hypothetical protein